MTSKLEIMRQMIQKSYSDLARQNSQVADSNPLTEIINSVNNGFRDLNKEEYIKEVDQSLILTSKDIIKEDYPQIPVIAAIPGIYSLSLSSRLPKMTKSSRSSLFSKTHHVPLELHGQLPEPGPPHFPGQLPGHPLLPVPPHFHSQLPGPPLFPGQLPAPPLFPSQLPGPKENQSIGLKSRAIEASETNKTPEKVIDVEVRNPFSEFKKGGDNFFDIIDLSKKTYEKVKSMSPDKPKETPAKIDYDLFEEITSKFGSEMKTPVKSFTHTKKIQYEEDDEGDEIHHSPLFPHFPRDLHQFDRLQQISQTLRRYSSDDDIRSNQDDDIRSNQDDDYIDDEDLDELVSAFGKIEGTEDFEYIEDDEDIDYKNTITISERQLLLQNILDRIDQGEDIEIPPELLGDI